MPHSHMPHADQALAYDRLLFSSDGIFFINTDRGHDNWLVRYEISELPQGPEGAEAGQSEWSILSGPQVEIAAIDNGLAFPFKHPDEWRACELTAMMIFQHSIVLN